MTSPVGIAAAMKLRLVVVAALTAGTVPVAIGVYLVLKAQPEPSADEASTSEPSFTISGTAQAPSTPGSTVPIHLALTNPHPYPITVSALAVRVDAVANRDGGIARCAGGNFTVRQFAGGYGFVLAAARTVSLSDLGFRGPQWPQLSMINSRGNQDGCKRAIVRLAVVGTARRAAP